MASLLQEPPEGDVSRAPGFIACVATVTTAALVMVCLRMYVRIRVINAVGWDDWTILLAMSLNLLLLAFNSIQVSFGYGRHEYYLSPKQQIESTKYNVIATVVVVMGSCLAKVSICLFLLRLLGDAVAKKRKWFLYILILVLFLYNILDIITLLIQCRPTTKIWNRQIPGSCWNPKIQDDFAYMQGALSIFSAFALSAFPVLIFKDLQMNLRTKIALCSLMGLGVIDGICSLVRTTLLPGFQASMDYSYTSIPISDWAALEQAIAIIAACLPTVRPLFRFFDSTQKRPSSYRNRQGFSRHRELGIQLSTFSKGTSCKDEEYGMKNHIFSRPGESTVDDNRSEESTLPLRDPTTIRKTTEIDVSR